MTYESSNAEEVRKRNASSIHLGMKPTNYRTNQLANEVLIEPKFDGICLLDVNGTLQSLQGVPFDCAAHLAADLGAIRSGFAEPVVLHGEYMEPGGFEATLAAFNAKSSSTGQVALWDAVPLEAWRGQVCGRPLAERRSALQKALQPVRPKRISLVPAEQIDRPNEHAVRAALATATDEGLEGIVIKDLAAPYLRGPSPYWLKLKERQTLDVRIRGLKWSDRARGRLTGIIIDVSGKTILIATGFTDQQRASPADFRIGRYVEISHQGRLTSGELRSATFRRFRDDKESAHGRT